MDKIWLQHYPKGVPAEVDVQAFASLREVLRHSCDQFSELPAYTNLGASISYAELDQHSRNCAAWLQNIPGLNRGDRVALMLPNLLQYPVALLGVLRAGLVVVNVNPQYTASELAEQLLDADVVAIVVLENFAHTLQQVLQTHPTLTLTVVTTQVGDLLPVVKELMTNIVVKYVKKRVPAWHIEGAIRFNAALRAGRSQPLYHVPLKHDDIAFLQYTGGTTGVSKGAVLTHGNVVANLQQLAAWMALQVQEGREVLVCPLPLYHIFALTASLVFFKIGAHTVLITNPKDMPAFIHDLKKYPVTILIGVNTLYRALLETPEFSEVRMPHLKLVVAGGMATQRAVANRWKTATGVPIVESYGLTEASPGVTFNPLTTQDWNATIGLPLPSTQVAILDEHARVLPIGEVGEIAVRGPQVMPCYWRRPDETALVLTPEGWLRTGDMGVMDARGYVTLTDRKKDMMVVSGFKVFPTQIEAVVMLHPGVSEVAALGVPDEKSGEVVKIIVVRRDLTLTATDLIEHCRQYLTAYKVPKQVEFRDEPLPKSNIGKILRRQLR